MPNAELPEYLLCFVTETLACGHQLTIFPDPDPLVARFRRCHECDVIKAPKKPVQSVRIADVERKQA